MVVPNVKLVSEPVLPQSRPFLVGPHLSLVVPNLPNHVILVPRLEWRSALVVQLLQLAVPLLVVVPVPTAVALWISLDVLAVRLSLLLVPLPPFAVLLLLVVPVGSRLTKSLSSQLLIRQEVVLWFSVPGRVPMVVLFQPKSKL